MYNTQLCLPFMVSIAVYFDISFSTMVCVLIKMSAFFFFRKSFVKYLLIIKRILIFALCKDKSEINN